MENKINIAEILKDCPSGMELDCVLFDDDVKVIFDGIDGINTCASFIKIVVIHNNNRISHSLTKYGQWNPYKYAKCVIFPKGKNTWEGFQRPFKDGDVLVHTQNKRFVISIYKSNEIEKIINTHAILWDREEGLSVGMQICCYTDSTRFATEEEKAKLFQAIKDNGYHWNAETKTLEKLIEPKFKVGDIIHDVDYYKVQITEINEEEELYIYCSVIAKGIGAIAFEEQDNWKLVHNKFDITTLKPFESKVLVRDKNNDKWIGQFFSHYDNGSDRPYICIGVEGLCEYKKMYSF